VLQEELSELKIPTTSSGIEPATFSVMNMLHVSGFSNVENILFEA
jgi:hypothetical protein